MVIDSKLASPHPEANNRSESNQNWEVWDKNFVRCNEVTRDHCISKYCLLWYLCTIPFISKRLNFVLDILIVWIYWYILLIPEVWDRLVRLLELACVKGYKCSRLEVPWWDSHTSKDIKGFYSLVLRNWSVAFKKAHLVSLYVLKGYKWF